MTRFVDFTLSGLVDGAIYSAFALSLVLIWRATRILNFALSSMAMLSAYVCYSIVLRNGSYWLGFAAALVSGLLLGALVERILMRRVENGPPLNPVIVTLGLLILMESIAGMIFGVNNDGLPTPFSTRQSDLFGVRFDLSPFDFFLLGAVGVLLLGLVVLFRFTSVGLRMRAAAFEPEVARLLGVRVGRMFTLGWALASMAGALAGLLVPRPAFLNPSYLEPALVYGFTAAVIGGLDSPPGAVVGGMGLGLVLSYVDGYFTNGSDLVNVAALVILLVVLMVRPAGLFSRATARRV
jgi:branched-chain amino acid transport system permease protein